MKLSILKLGLVAVLGIMGCCSYSEGIVGNYKSKEYGYINKNLLSFFKNETFVLGSSLRINGDSTYLMVNCGNIQKGNWQVHNDSLLLYCEENRMRSDSTDLANSRKEFLDCGDSPSIFIIDKNVLKQEWKLNNQLVLNYLEKLK